MKVEPVSTSDSTAIVPPWRVHIKRIADPSIDCRLMNKIALAATVNELAPKTARDVLRQIFSVVDVPADIFTHVVPRQGMNRP